jgi:hypothetical protein
VVAGHAIHTLPCQTGTPQQVAATNDQPKLDALANDSLNLSRQSLDHLRVDAVTALPHQGLAAQFQQYSFV